MHANVVVNMVGRQFATRNFSMEEANVLSAERIAKASLRADRFIFISAVGADPESPSEFLRLKAAAEEKVRSIIPDATIIRITRMFGAEDNYLVKYGWLSRVSPFVPQFHSDVETAPVYVRLWFLFVCFIRHEKWSGLLSRASDE